ncbi:MAG TPA: metallophosphoesterase [Candidatus Sumerlaeota bacterium]|mgnify:CR=1 FL=1|nr:metallophosphoesterase [Candidatus Sumerlaeota bacterium]
MSFFGSMLTLLTTLMHLYVFGRAYTLPMFRRPSYRRALIITGAALWLIFFLGRAYGGDRYGFLTVALEMAGMHWMAGVFLIAIGMLIGDLACGFGFLFRKVAGRVRTGGLMFGLALILLAHVQGLRPPVIETHEVSVKDLPARLDGTTIAMMADMHVGELMVGPRWLNARVAQVQALRPDMIVLAGDLFERSSDPAEMTPVMRQMSAPLGVWAVRGNHDTVRPNRRDATGEILAGAGIRILSNEWVNPADGLTLAGIDDLTSSRRRAGEGEANLDRALADRPANPTILLSHTPWLTDRAAAAGVALMLSGHTHNGQIWPFKYLVRARYPFITGRYEMDGMTLIVTRGTGTWGPRMRLWAPGEITLITLRSDTPGR